MPRIEALRLYTRPSDHEPLAWSWVDDELRRAGTYWVVARSAGHPHPRPVWGVWTDERLHLSIGTPANRAALAADPLVTVHLDSGTEPVIVEGTVVGSSADPEVVAAYDRKYDWTYDIDSYGPFTTISPDRVLAWQTTGPAGRDSFQRTGRWTFA